MPKPIAQSVLFQLGAVMNPLAEGAKITNIRAFPAGASIYGDAFTNMRKPDAAAAGAPQSILARTQQNAKNTSQIDWDEILLNPASDEAAMEAIVRAGELKDARATSALFLNMSASAPWMRKMQFLDSDKVIVEDFFDQVYVSLRQVTNDDVSLLVRVLTPMMCRDDCDKIGYEAAELFENLASEGVECRAAISFLLSLVEKPPLDLSMDDSYIVRSIEVLRAIGGTGVQQRVLESIAQNPHRAHVHDGVYAELESWGISDSKITAALSYERKRELVLEDGAHIAAYAALTRGRDAKRTILEGSAVLDTLADPQGWITINDPALARAALDLVASRAKSKRGKLDNAINAALGVHIKEIKDAHFTFYADEILDAVVQFVKQSKFKNDPSVKGLLAQVKYGDDVRLRYIRRDVTDTSLGSKCGDCTSKGSIHFGDSMTWFINPAYQIIKMFKGKRFIGKIQFALGRFDGKDSIIIDALEFNPQAQEGKPYYEDGVACFTEAKEFLKELARRQNRQLIALRTSNSSGALEMLGEWGRMLDSTRKIAIKLLIPRNEVKELLKRHGHYGEVSLYYQMLGESQHVDLSQDGHDRVDDKLPNLEREVVNPAQIASDDVAAAMRARDFDLASKHIMANAEWNGQVKAIFGIPADMGLSPAFLAKRLKDIYRDEAVDMENLQQGFLVDADNFLRIPTE